jgi:hypothetical protein
VGGDDDDDEDKAKHLKDGHGMHVSDDVPIEIRVTRDAGVISQAKATAWLKDHVPWRLEPTVRSDGSASILSGALATEDLHKYLNQEGDEN